MTVRERSALNAGTHESAVDDFGNQYLARVAAPSPALTREAHDLVVYPKVGKFAEVRMVYCTRCGATQPVEAGDRPPLGPCFLSALGTPPPAELDALRETATAVVEGAEQTTARPDSKLVLVWKADLAALRAAVSQTPPPTEEERT